MFHLLRVESLRFAMTMEIIVVSKTFVTAHLIYRL